MTKEAMVRSVLRRAALEKAAAASTMPAAPSYLDRGTAVNPAGTNYLGRASMSQQQPVARQPSGNWMAALGKGLLLGPRGVPRGVGAMWRAVANGRWPRQTGGSRSPIQTGMY